MGIPQLITQKEASALLKVSVKTLEDWRRNGKGPKFYRLEQRAVRYCLADTEAWLAASLNRSQPKEPLNV